MTALSLPMKKKSSWPSFIIGGAIIGGTMGANGIHFFSASFFIIILTYSFVNEYYDA
jgi:hypothetical protein